MGAENAQGTEFVSVLKTYKNKMTIRITSQVYFIALVIVYWCPEPVAANN